MSYSEVSNTSNEVTNTTMFIQMLFSLRCHDVSRNIKPIDDNDRRDEVSSVVPLIEAFARDFLNCCVLA